MGMTQRSRTRHHHHRASRRGGALVCGAALLSAACPGDDAPAQTTAGESSSSSTGSDPTTIGPPPGTTTTADVSSSGIDPDATEGQTTMAFTSDATTTGGVTTTGDVTTGDVTTTDGSGSSGSGGETGTGEQGYGDCFNNPAMDVCLAGETCIDDAGMPPGVAVCALQDCAGAGSCPSAPPGGNASPACMDVTGDMVDECVLQCAGGATCPTGMACFAEFVCVWGGGVGPGDFTCVDEDLGSATGNAVASGSTVGETNDQDPSCAMSSAPDVAFVWTALVGGTYTFDTVGSSFDTVLFVREDCVGAELACNDDAVMLQSQVAVDLMAGQSVTVVVDGWGNSTGNYVLNIN
jgi:hypothetical protein